MVIEKKKLEEVVKESAGGSKAKEPAIGAKKPVVKKPPVKKPIVKKTEIEKKKEKEKKKLDR